MKAASPGRFFYFPAESLACGKRGRKTQNRKIREEKKHGYTGCAG
jgi:hypothetical protein